MLSKSSTFSHLKDKVKPSKSTTFSHLKPLSAYGKAVFAEVSLNKIPEPITNFKSEDRKNRATKRKLEDSVQDGCFETLAKKPEISRNVSTPDENCFLSHCSHPIGQDSPLVPCQASPFVKTQPIKLTTSESVSLEHVVSKSSPGACSLAGTDPCVFKYEVVPQPVFDPDVKELGTDEDVDKGYLSMCLTPSLRPPTSSSPILKVAEDKIHPPSKVSHSVNGPDPAVSGLSLDSVLESFSGDVEELWNIGPPVLESSVCGKEEGGPGSPQDRDKEKLSTSIPSTSKVSILSDRPVVLNTKADWEREIKKYVQLVHSHLSEASDAAQDAISELQSLLTQVEHDSSGRPWQHVSDLTRRNYRAGLRNGVPKISLDEWQAKSLGTHKRFKRVQKIFERSSIS